MISLHVYGVLNGTYAFRLNIGGLWFFSGSVRKAMLPDLCAMVRRLNATVDSRCHKE